MTQEEQVYYERYFDTFSTSGWKQFIEDIQEIHDSYRIEDLHTDRQLAFVQGERRILDRILNFETSIRNTYDYTMEVTNDSPV